MNNVNVALEQLKVVQKKLDKARAKKEAIQRKAELAIFEIEEERLILREERKNLMEILAR